MKWIRNGKNADSINGTGYYQVKFYFKGKRLTMGSHRFIYSVLVGIPANFVDHINGNGLDNRLANLRDVTNTVNARNINAPIRTNTGVRGVYWYKPGQYFTAKATIDGRLTQLGFGDLLHCVALRKSAEQRLGFL